MPTQAGNLLDLIVSSVDEDYRTSAERRAAAGKPPNRSRIGLRVGVAVFGALIGISALVAHQQAPTLDRQRTELIDAIHAREQALSTKRQQVADLTHTLDRLNADVRALGRQSTQAATEVATLQLSSGGVAVSGPGVVVVVDDAPGTISPSSQGAIRDTDLQSLVNGLWAGGAESIAINGYRIGPLTSIRFAGEAITVNYHSLSPPYRIEVIGDPSTLPARFAETPGGQLFASLRSNLHVGYSITSATRLSLPANTREHLLYATLATGGHR